MGAKVPISFSPVSKRKRSFRNHKKVLSKKTLKIQVTRKHIALHSTKHTSLSLVCVPLCLRARVSPRVCFPCFVVIQQLLDSSNGALAAEFPLATSAVSHRSSSIVVPDLPCGCQPCAQQSGSQGKIFILSVCLSVSSSVIFVFFGFLSLRFPSPLKLRRDRWSMRVVVKELAGVLIIRVL